MEFSIGSNIITYLRSCQDLSIGPCVEDLREHQESPSVPLTGALVNCLIVGHSSGFNCIGERGASKNIGLDRT